MAYIQPEESESEDSLVVMLEVLVTWHNPVKAFLVLSQVCKSREEPAVAQLTLVHIESVTLSYDELRILAYLVRSQPLNARLVQRLVEVSVLKETASLSSHNNLIIVLVGD